MLPRLHFAMLSLALLLPATSMPAITPISKPPRSPVARSSK